MSASRKKSSSSIKTETNNKPTTKKQDALNKEFVKIFEEKNSHENERCPQAKATRHENACCTQAFQLPLGLQPT